MKRLCRVCGGEYDYCYSCEKVRSWRALTDTADHYYVLNVLMDYQTDHDALKAYRALRKRGVDIRETDGLLPSVKALMEEIASVVRSANEAKRKAVSPSKDDVVKKNASRTSSENNAEGNTQE